MSIIIKLAFLVLCVVTWIQTKRVKNHELCGVEIVNFKRAVRGRTMTLCQYSWVVYILMYKNTICTGTLIDNRHVIASAKLLYPGSSQLPVTPDHAEVWFDSDTDLQHGDWYRNVSHIFIHDTYTHSTKDNIAILRLSEPVKFGECPTPVCLISDKTQPQSSRNKTCKAVSYVSHDGVNIEPNWVDQRITTRKNCARIYGPIKKMFCAGGQGHDICAGDTGGPIMCKHNDGRYYMYGLVNVARDQDCGMTYTLYTKVSSYLTWINEKTKVY